MLHPAAPPIRGVDGPGVVPGVAADPASAEDRRSTYATLTKAGRALQRSAGPTVLRLLEDQVATAFTDDELRQLATLLGRLASPPATD